MTIPDGTEEGYYWVKYVGIWRPAYIDQYAMMDADLPWEWRVYPTKFDGWIEIEQIEELGPRIVPPDHVPAPTLPPPPAPRLDQRSM